MKKFKWVIMAAVILYLLTAVTILVLFMGAGSESERYYRVELNRITQDALKHIDQLNSGKYRISVRDLQSVRNVTYLREGSSAQEIQAFYMPTSKMHMEVVPLYSSGVLQGYLKADYVNKDPVNYLLGVAEAGILFLFFFICICLAYVDQKILHPFQVLSRYPEELSRGNLSATIQENRNRYFGKFIWGISMLKDSLESHEKREMKLAREKKLLIVALSHDIRTPLNAILLYAKALERKLYISEQEQIQAAIGIQKHAAEIEMFVNDIVKSSTEDVVSIAVQEGEFYLKELLEQIRYTYHDKCRIRALDLQIEPYCDIILMGDRERAYEAACNLIENALKYGDGRWLVISCSEEESCTMISFRNSGVPVEENEMNHLFESFYRGSNSEGKKGNGLGLYICREIMKKCHGDIFAKSRPEGMEFVLVFRQR